MTNGERADRLISDAGDIAVEMRGALQRGRWNLATRRAQEVIELVVKALLSEMTIDYPRTHDPAPVLVEEIERRNLHVDVTFLGSLKELSARLAKLRAPAFYQEVAVGEADARWNVDAAERVLAFGRDLLARLRRP